MPPEAVIQGRIAFNQALAGDHLQALQTVRGISDDWSRGHILAFHILPLMSKAEHYGAAFVVALSIHKNPGARLNAFLQLAVQLESYGVHEQAVQAFHESGKALQELRKEIERENTHPEPIFPAPDEPITPAPSDLPEPAPNPPDASPVPSTKGDDETVPEESAAHSVPEMVVQVEGLHWYQNYAGAICSAFVVYVFAVIKPFCEACFKTVAGPQVVSNGWFGPALLTLLGFAAPRVEVRQPQKACFLFGAEGTIKQSVQVEMKSEADFQCIPDDERVTPEMVKQVWDDLERRLVRGHVNGVEWHQGN